MPKWDWCQDNSTTNTNNHAKTIGKKERDMASGPGLPLLAGPAIRAPSSILMLHGREGQSAPFHLPGPLTR
jgi:hypothetical protein